MELKETDIISCAKWCYKRWEEIKIQFNTVSTYYILSILIDLGHQNEIIVHLKDTWSKDNLKLLLKKRVDRNLLNIYYFLKIIHLIYGRIPDDYQGNIGEDLQTTLKSQLQKLESK